MSISYIQRPGAADVGAGVEFTPPVACSGADVSGGAHRWGRLTKAARAQRRFQGAGQPRSRTPARGPHAAESTGLDVPVKDAQSMRIIDRRGDVSTDRHRGVHRHRPTPHKARARRFWPSTYGITTRYTRTPSWPASSTGTMFGWCSRPRILDLATEAERAERDRELRSKHLDGDLPAERQVFGQVDGRHGTVPPAWCRPGTFQSSCLGAGAALRASGPTWLAAKHDSLWPWSRRRVA